MRKIGSRTAGSLINFSAINLSIVAILGSANFAYSQENSTSNSNDNSKLRKFERSIQLSQQSTVATVPVSTRYDYRNHFHSEPGISLSDEFMNWIGELGQLTWQRPNLADGSESRRNEGDILIPFIRYDFAYQKIASNIHANSHRLEAGYGPFAVFLEEYILNETAPDNTLKVSRQLLLYRMSSDPMFEVDFGIGQSIVSGVQRTTLDTISLPIKVVFSENVALAFRPTWAGVMSDYEIALHIGQQYGSIKVGYRTLNAPDSRLSGPFAGLSIYY